MSTALLVIDPQRIYTDRQSELYCADSRRTIERMNRLIDHFVDRSHPIILVRHIHKADGSDLGRLFDFTGEAEDDFNFKEGSPEVEYDERIHQPPGARHLIKNRYSAFAKTSLDATLRQAKVNTVAVCGFMTNFCCASTARQAHDLDYFVDFIVDATGTPGTDNFDQSRLREVVAELLGAGYARVATTSQYLAQHKRSG